MDPNPIKHLGSLMKKVRSEIEPALFSAGFAFDGRNKPVRPGPDPMWLDYSRPDMLFRYLYEPHQARLIAEIADEKQGYRTVVATDMNMPRSASQLMARIDAFTSAVTDFLASLPAVPK